MTKTTDPAGSQHKIMNHAATNTDIWQGRIDAEDGDTGMRFHQKVILIGENDQLTNQAGVVLLGFACDEGVKRNKGRVGAVQAPDLIRKALANMAWHHAVAIDTGNSTSTLVDAGNIYCNDTDLAASQKELANHVETALNQQNKVMVLGGGHEIAWGTFQGLAQHFQNASISKPKIGIINFDAHFDLRTYSADEQAFPTSSGTPFNQIAKHCQQLGWAFNYACLGVSRASNTQALFTLADQLGVHYREDHQLASYHLAERIEELIAFIDNVDYLYLTIDIDVFSASTAPGVSAPAARGVNYESVEALLQPIFNAKNTAGQAKLRVADLAEYNPNFDIDNQTARLAARLTWDITRAMFK
ncbi:Formimidoylglutamase-Formiminoglutamase-Formiminoglutamate hydrolase [Moritella viscosa]|uniref:Formimidoylglutamase n=1 Tax=Moritella viscosa TaxID=80854 RepID=A0A090IEY0_9GAMM|nr:formimidoylglutamase [Moritella viscosa]CED60666.1 formiminoglutamase [Moritella viscosa]SGZ15241.1 Formimidoylglutamase-Formiminoglutamase-Formiminoglutamate hydrolase [Moritella viscosa]SHO12403.1 Formimidoylglutamase-Formiminoglutamase-Formiminoglutamate hydrolase [Moritella viscosa]SHO14934.1 Formimidoylglutamase-Formiminoglutamase-Formiminoglutamate hydrolase [Moritella viscosa]SHO14951.1 Formimidoylglutamase-Formiminoglutamase-Formiminoglutamate hydrolase [Moritella viscosa]